jgi:5-deoxy-glucuronate isomerase
VSAKLHLKPDLSGVADAVHRVTPASAGWQYLGFEVIDLKVGRTLERSLPDREQCFVLIGGRARVAVNGEDFGTIGARGDPFAGKPFALYAPPRAAVKITAETPVEVAVGSAPAQGLHPARLIRPEDVSKEVRGTGTNTRYVYDILPESVPAEHLLVVEVVTPGGHWSSYPPHKHDSAQGGESQLEETYYHRLSRPGGFGFQRVYTEDRSLDESMAIEDRDLVLVPRGHHPVSAPHGFDLYYLNVMAGPERRGRISYASGFEFLTRR